MSARVTHLVPGEHLAAHRRAALRRGRVVVCSAPTGYGRDNYVVTTEVRGAMIPQQRKAA